MDNRKARFVCWLFGHDSFSTQYTYWEKTGINFKCRRCAFECKNADDIL